MPFLKCELYRTPRSRVLQNSAHKQGWRHAIVTPDKDTFKGEWDKSYKHGYGSMLTRSNRLYEGYWTRDFRHNFGVSSHRQPDKVFTIDYRGNWRKGHYGGFGEKHYYDGSYYKGNFKNSKRNGYGQQWNQDGSFYDGDWCRDLRHGLGMFVEPNGNRYEGSWKEDLKHGRGRYFHLDSGQMQEGVWIDDNCATSFIVDIPYRQTSIYPSQIPIQENKLVDCNLVYSQAEEEVLLSNFQEAKVFLTAVNSKTSKL